MKYNAFLDFSQKENFSMILCTIFKTPYSWVQDCIKFIFCQLSESVVWMLKSNNHGKVQLKGAILDNW